MAQEGRRTRVGRFSCSAGHPGDASPVEERGHHAREFAPVAVLSSRWLISAVSQVKALQILEGQGGIGSPVVATTKGSKAARSGGLEIALDRGAGSVQELLVRLDANQFYSGPRGAALGRLG